MVSEVRKVLQFWKKTPVPVNSTNLIQIGNLVRLVENSEARKSGARQMQLEYAQNPVAFMSKEPLAQNTRASEPSIADEYFGVFSGTGVRVRREKDGGNNRGPATSLTLLFSAAEGQRLDSGFFRSFFENMHQEMKSEGYSNIDNSILAPNEMRVDIFGSTAKIAELEIRVRRWEAKRTE